MEAISYKLDVFEGPLDLLLHLLDQRCAGLGCREESDIVLISGDILLESIIAGYQSIFRAALSAILALLPLL